MSGDDIDSNGDILMNEGEVYIFGPENSGNACLIMVEKQRLQEESLWL